METVVTTKPLIGISGTADLETVARVMTAKDISALGVYTPDGSDLVGIITERDVARAVAEAPDPARASVVEYMTDQPISVQPGLSKDEAIDVMRRTHVRHLVVRGNGADRIVSIRDL